MTNKLNHTDGTWEEGNTVDSIICKTGIDAEDKRMGSLEYYGGHVICESVEPKNRPIIMASPKMLKALTAIYKAQFDKTGTLQALNNRIKESKEVIEKATGKKIEDILK